jgi:hypothetical protein
VKKLMMYITLATSIIATGCATILDGSDQTISVKSDPNGASVYMGDKLLGKTPITTTVKKEKDKQLTFKKSGYQTDNVLMNTGISPYFWVNILTGGITGSIVDLSTGAMYQYQPNSYYLKMKPTKVSSNEEFKNSLVVFGLAVEGYDDLLKEFNGESDLYISSIVKASAGKIGRDDIEAAYKVSSNNLEFAKSLDKLM